MLRFEYDMLYRFAAPVINHSFSLKCLPMNTSRQKICSMALDIQPHIRYSRTVDSFGNGVIYGRAEHEHDFFRVTLWGTALTGLSVEELFDEHDNFDDLYKMFSKYTVPGKGLCEFFSSFELPDSDYKKVLYIMDKLYCSMSYCLGCTDINTAAEQAFSIRKGVCQDYAHIFIALLRMCGIACRYVVGMMKGEGESHAWAEAHLLGYWYGFDPTHNRLVDGDYIKISHGRDYADCIVSKGVFTNRTEETLDIHVRVE